MLHSPGLTVSCISVYYGKTTEKKTVSDNKPWDKASITMAAAINTVDTKRGRLEPVFNPEESTMIQIIKGERGEQLIEIFRNQLVELQNATNARNLTRTLQTQKKALLSLADVGGP